MAGIMCKSGFTARLGGPFLRLLLCSSPAAMPRIRWGFSFEINKALKCPCQTKDGRYCILATFRGSDFDTRHSIWPSNMPSAAGWPTCQTARFSWWLRAAAGKSVSLSRASNPGCRIRSNRLKSRNLTRWVFLRGLKSAGSQSRHPNLE